MAYVISDECISCGACEAECPVSAISAGDGKDVNRRRNLHQLWCLCRCLPGWRSCRKIMVLTEKAFAIWQRPFSFYSAALSA